LMVALEEEPRCWKKAMEINFLDFFIFFLRIQISASQFSQWSFDDQNLNVLIVLII
jgi:hypothetical protein